ISDQVESIHILSSNEEATKLGLLADLKEQSERLRKERLELEVSRTWIETHERLTAELSNAEQRFQRALQQKDAEQGRFDKWAAHLKVVPFEARILSYRQSEE